ncbi:hypothetical protein PHYPSEUDO_014658 [Phytophthora pseudosyringae]|uniref:Uncharacterized protein n=1 Tax=Phytophthora pseudosyringae TaxID=221518 RepID=A0A8T1W3I9_9STRA|nr:hypothetical protein PHYPSEUDO_014658 [Phytophthora pseudosyringae]
MDLSAKGEAPAPVPSRAAPGEDGGHGAPGRYGANLVLRCRSLENGCEIVKLLTSTGQQGGVGQNGGRGTWERAFKSLPRGFKLENSSAVEVPPANRDIVRAVAGSVVLTAAMGVSAVVPNRITKTELQLSRANVEGSKGLPPGRRGNGGGPGFGGALHVLEAGQERMNSHGSRGECGKPGTSGRSSWDGKASISVQGQISQEYDLCGQRLGPPTITATAEFAQAPRQLIQNTISLLGNLPLQCRIH